MLKDELSNCTPLADEFLGWELVSNRSRWVDQTWRFHLEENVGSMDVHWQNRGSDGLRQELWDKGKFWWGYGKKPLIGKLSYGKRYDCAWGYV